MAPASRTSKAPAAKKAAPKKAAAKASATKTSSAKKAPAKKAPAKKAPATKVSAGTAPAKAVAARNGAAGKAPSTGKAAAKKASTAKATKAKRSPFSAAFLAAQKAALVEERATYLHQAESLQAEAEALVADFVSGDAQFDEDGGEGDTLSSERERDLALSAQARAAIDEIDHALEKFELGTYGICEASGEPIPEERLEAIPWARVQVQYKTGGIGRP